MGSSSQNGVAANTDELKKAYDALKGIVKIAKKEKVDVPQKSEIAISAAHVGRVFSSGWS